MADDKAPAESIAASVAEEAAPIVAEAAPVEAVAETPAEVVVAGPGSAIEGADADAEPKAEGDAGVEAAPAEAEKPAEPVETKPDAEKPAEEVKAEAVEPALPTYEDFKLPEGLEAQPERIAEFTGVIGKYGLSQEAGQELMDLHGAALAQQRDMLEQHQRDVFAETNKKWVGEFEKKAGNRRDTILNDAKWAIQQVIPDAEVRKEFWSVMSYTGSGNHPAMIYAWAAAAKQMRERAAPPPGLPPRTQPTNPAERRYGRART